MIREIKADSPSYFSLSTKVQWFKRRQRNQMKFTMAENKV
jgi:hypothetical protein